MKIVYTAATSLYELEQILELQQRNLPTQLSPAEKAEEGFVTVSHTLELLERMNSACPHTLAKDGDRVVGYALSMHPKFRNEIDVLKPMFDQIETAVSENEQYIVMGQICIDKAYRKKGIFRGLYTAMKRRIQQEFTITLLSFISTVPLLIANMVFPLASLVNLAANSSSTGTWPSIFTSPSCSRETIGA